MFSIVNDIFMDTCEEFGVAYAEGEDSAVQGDLYLTGDEAFAIMEMRGTAGEQISAWQYTDDMIEALEMARVLKMRGL